MANTFEVSRYIFASNRKYPKVSLGLPITSAAIPDLKAIPIEATLDDIKNDSSAGRYMYINFAFFPSLNILPFEAS